MAGATKPIRWRVKERYAPHKGLIRMSWNRYNVYNLHQRTRKEDNSRRSVFQQKWSAKRDLRAYHVPNITETQLLQRHWRNQLPMRHLTASEKERLPPVQALAFGETERRLDVAVFRAHFASSIWMARMAVVHGHVKVNGEKCKFPSRRLHSGDMVTINPRIIPMLRPQTMPVNNNNAKELEEAAAEAEKDAESNEAKVEVKAEKVDAEQGSDAKPDSAAKAETKDGSTKENGTGGKTAEKKDAQKPTTVINGLAGLPFRQVPWMSPFMFLPAYLEVCYNTTSFVFLRPPLPQPGRVEIPSPHPPELHSLAYEWYSSIKSKRTKRPPPNYPLVVNGISVRLKPKFDLMVRRRLLAERDERRNFAADLAKKGIPVDDINTVD